MENWKTTVISAVISQLVRVQKMQLLSLRKIMAQESILKKALTLFALSDKMETKESDL